MIKLHIHYLYVDKPCSLQVYSKETSTQVFSYEYCEIFKNNYLKNISERMRKQIKLLLDHNALH